MRTLRKKREVMLAVAAVVLLICLCAPLLAVAKYNYPQGDDLGNSAGVRHLVEGGAGLWAILREAAFNASNAWKTWQGSFTACFLMALQPGVFGEGYYQIGTWILLGSLLAAELFLCRRIFWRSAGKSGCVALWALTAAVQVMFVPYPNETFYWFCGAVYYTFFYSLSLCLCAEALFLLREGISARQMCVHGALAVFLAFAVGGGNLATGLGTAVFLAVLVIWGGLYRKRQVLLICPVLAVYLGSYALNVFAPGNAVRQAASSMRLPPPYAVWLALYHSFRNCREWLLDVRVILILLVLIPILWKLTGTMKCRFRMPALFTLVAFGVYASQMAPISYVNGSYGPIRMVDIFWYGSILLFVIVEAYWLGWLRTREKIVDRLAGVRRFCRTHFGVLQLGLLILWGAAVLGGNRMECSSYIAYRALNNGYAQAFAAEQEERLAILRDDSLDEVWLKRIENRAEPLFYCDISAEGGYFNIAMADYYGKSGVNLKE